MKCHRRKRRKPRRGLRRIRVKNGGADRDRTCDLLIANETLYQLSYDPVHRPFGLEYVWHRMPAGAITKADNASRSV
jgi:hypothetical protein